MAFRMFGVASLIGLILFCYVNPAEIPQGANSHDGPTQIHFPGQGSDSTDTGVSERYGGFGGFHGGFGARPGVKEVTKVDVKVDVDVHKETHGATGFGGYSPNVRPGAGVSFPDYYHSPYDRYNYRFPSGSNFYPSRSYGLTGTGVYDRRKPEAADEESGGEANAPNIFSEPPEEFSTTIISAKEVQRTPGATALKSSSETWSVDCNGDANDGYISGIVMSNQGVDFVQCMRRESTAKGLRLNQGQSTRFSLIEGTQEFSNLCPLNNVLTGLHSSDPSFSSIDYAKCTSTAGHLAPETCQDSFAREILLPASTKQHLSVGSTEPQPVSIQVLECPQMHAATGISLQPTASIRCCAVEN